MTRIAYACFDRFPSPKGAAVHVDAFVRALAARFGEVDLVTIDPAPRPEFADEAARWGAELAALGVRHHPLPAPGPHLFARVLAYRAQFLSWLERNRPEVLHVRSIYEGYPVARRGRELCDRLVVEINGLPSVELKYHYAQVADDRGLLGKLLAQERTLLEAADLVLTPSAVTARHLALCGADAARVRVIPNGVRPELFPYHAPAPIGDRPARWIYWGTLSAWQGVGVAIEALQLYRRDRPATLTLVGPARPRQRRALLELCHDLGVGPHVQLLPPLPQAELARQIAAHDLAIAPLQPDDRNLVQGCSPLKVIEALAVGTPLIASDLEVVRDLTGDDSAYLVRPGSAKALKDAALEVVADPELARRRSLSGRARVEADLTWDRAGRRLVAAYADLLGSSAESTPRSAASS